MKNVNEPHGKRANKYGLGSLKNDNPPCDLRSLPRCQAKAKSTGRRCGNAAMKGKEVCYIHGGRSTGPRTTDGLERSRKANWKHGFYSAESIGERRYIRELLNKTLTLIKRV